MRVIEAILVAIVGTVVAVIALAVGIVLAALPYAFAVLVVVETLRLLGVLG